MNNLLAWCKAENEAQKQATATVLAAFRQYGVLGFRFDSDYQIAQRLGLRTLQVRFAIADLRRDGLVDVLPCEPDAQHRRAGRELRPGPLWEVTP